MRHSLVPPALGLECLGLCDGPDYGEPCTVSDPVGHGSGQAPRLWGRGGPLLGQGLYRPHRPIQSPTPWPLSAKAGIRAGEDPGRTEGQRRRVRGVPGPADPRDPHREGPSGPKRDFSHQPREHKTLPRPKIRGKLELVEKKLTELAETFELMELAGSSMDIYMRIRPKVPEGKAG